MVEGRLRRPWGRYPRRPAVLKIGLTIEKLLKGAKARSWLRALRGAPASRSGRTGAARGQALKRGMLKDAKPRRGGVFSIGGGVEIMQAKARYSRSW